MTGTEPLNGDLDGQTPLTDEDLAGLLPTWVATRADLNRAEQANLLAAATWAARRQWTTANLLTVPALGRLHRRMYGDVWTWAGVLRRHDTNIGEPWHQIRMRVTDLCADVAAQAVGPTTALPLDEVAVRFHHRLVLIHPFANGNGRHGRLATDLLARTLGRPSFTWGSASLDGAGPIRDQYLAALRRADDGLDFDDLLAFARS